MTCSAIYINSDTDVSLNIISGFSTSDVTDLTAVLSNDTVTKTYKLSLDEIVLDSGVYILKILKNDITTAGVYSLAITLTDSYSMERRLCLSDSYLLFKP